MCIRVRRVHSCGEDINLGELNALVAVGLSDLGNLEIGVPGEGEYSGGRKRRIPIRRIWFHWVGAF